MDGGAHQAFFAKFLPPDVQERTRNAGGDGGLFPFAYRRAQKDLGDDLLSSMIMASEGGDKFTDDELIIQAIGVIVAGYETTIGLLGNGTRAFVEHPDQLVKLRDNPELVSNATDECLRYDTPILFNWRVLEQPYELGGVTLPAEAVIWQLLGAANRDPARFPPINLTLSAKMWRISHLAVARTSASAINLQRWRRGCVQ